MRIILGIEYKGTAYSGWQKQPHHQSIQQQLELALAKIADEPIQLLCAGRTDAGVHATFQIAHFETTARRDLHAWVVGTNTYLPADIKVFFAKETTAIFHARFSAQARRYLFILQTGAIAPALYRDELTWLPGPLSAAAMHAAGQIFLGEHDFSAFRGKDCQSLSPMRSVYEVNVQAKGNLILFEIEANAFLHHMVRLIAGYLVRIGLGQADLNWLRDCLLSKKRQPEVVMLAPQGLYLIGVQYPSSFELPYLERRPLLAQ